MPKKDFRSNPALQFISSAQEPEEETPASAPAPSPAPVKRSPDRNRTTPSAETKSRRVQLLIQPSLWSELETIAAAKGISNNEAVINAIRAYTRKER